LKKPQAVSQQRSNPVIRVRTAHGIRITERVEHPPRTTIERWQRQRECKEPEGDPANKLSGNHKVLLGLEHLEQGPHSGFSVHGHITSVVKKAICESLNPMLLYMSVDTVAIATKGSPSAKYNVGTQRAGWRILLLPDVISASLNDIRWGRPKKPL
jgi:hypothetical protein